MKIQILSQVGKHSLTIFTQISQANGWEELTALWSCCQTNTLNKDYCRSLCHNLKVMTHFYVSFN